MMLDLSPFVSADLVQELTRDNETWTLTINGFTDAELVQRLIWPSRVPPGVTITLKVAITDPIERGWFLLSGVTVEALTKMEPSFAKLFSERGVVDEFKEGKPLQDARRFPGPA